MFFFGSSIFTVPSQCCCRITSDTPWIEGIFLWHGFWTAALISSPYNLIRCWTWVLRMVSVEDISPGTYESYSYTVRASRMKIKLYSASSSSQQGKEQLGRAYCSWRVSSIMLLFIPPTAKNMLWSLNAQHDMNNEWAASLTQKGANK